MANPPKSPSSAPPQDTRETLKQLYIALKSEQRLRSEVEARQSEPIAIIGMGCRFPAGANDPAAFWDLLERGKDGVSSVPPDRWDGSSLLADPGEQETLGKMTTAEGGFLDVPLTRFDHAFFRLSPKEARALDPQHRLLLEVTWEALESAGLIPTRLKGGRTGVFVGLSGDDYSLAHRHSGDLTAIDAYSLTGSTASTAAGRIAYFLGTEGPAVPVDTACSSSLVALHLACQSLRCGETDLGLVGGVNLILAPSIHVCFSRLHAISPDGRCRSFDASANGYSRAEGCGMVVLKRLSDAQRDNDRILATICASAINQDGASNGFTAPNGAAQKRLILEALSKAKLSAADIQYVETHGTGTPLGDPIEVSALAETLGRARPATAPIVLGAVKSNIGHLEAAAGMAGLIKVILALGHGRIPANLHFQTPNPHIPWDNTPIRVPTEALPWTEATGPSGRRHAALSAFGFSGTNAHVILGEAPSNTSGPLPERHTPTPGTPTPNATSNPILLALSARSPAALARLAERMDRHLRALSPDQDLRSLCATALRHRTAFDQRLAVIGSSKEELIEALTAWRNAAKSPGTKSALRFGPAGPPQLEDAANTWLAGDMPDAMALFPDGSYRLADLPAYPFDPLPCFLGETEGPVIPQRKSPALDGDRRLEPVESPYHPLLSRRLSQGLQSPLLNQTLWETDLDLRRLPLLADHKVLGYPIMAAAGHLAMIIAAVREGMPDQAFTLEDITFSAPLVIPQSDSVRVHLLISEADGRGRKRIDIASIAGAQATRHVTATLVPGSSAPDLIPHRPLERETPGQKLSPDVIYTQQGDHLDLGPAFRRGTEFFRTAQGASVTFAPSREVSTGTAPAQENWGAALHPAVIDGGLQLLPLLMGIPEGAALVPVAIQHIHVAPHCALASRAFAQLTEDGTGQIEFLDAENRPLLVLSGVQGKPMDRRSLAGFLRTATAHSGGLSFYRSQWRPRNRTQGTSSPPQGHWIIIPPGQSSPDLDALRDILPDATRTTPFFSTTVPLEADHILWLRGLDQDDDRLSELVALTQALLNSGGKARLWIVTRGTQRVDGQESGDPLGAALWGLGRSLAKEAPHRYGGLLDLSPQYHPRDNTEADGPETIALALSEMITTGPNVDIAFRKGQSFEQTLVSSDIPVTPGGPIRKDATYLVTGGMGALGRQVVPWLLDAGAAHVAIVTRHAPAPDRVHKVFGPLSGKITVYEADVADQKAMARALATLDADLPPLAGVFHLAGTAASGLLSELDPAQLNTLISGKVRGAAVLDSLTRHRPLDHFVLFSSIAGVMGAAGQGLYAAANAFLDGLAMQRRRSGLPALSLAWGPWDGEGMAASPEARTQIERAGLQTIAPEQALAALPLILGLGLGWSDPVLALVMGAVDAMPRPSTAPENADLAQMDAEARNHALMTLLAKTAADSLGLSEDAILPTDRDLFELGLDSLMALRLRNAAEQALGTSLPTTLVFEHPRLDDLHAKLLDLFQVPVDQAKTTGTGEAPPKTRPADPTRLSEGQKGLWFLHRIAPTSSAFHTCFTAHCRNALVPEALEGAFCDAIARHAPLGNRISADEDGPINLPTGPDRFRLKVVPAEGWSEAALKADVEAAYHHPFRLDQDLPIRVTVWRRGPEDWVLMILVHHISMDVWSFDLLLEDIGSDYATRLAGTRPPVEPPARTFADHVQWMGDLLASEDGERLRTFWRGVVANAPPTVPPLASGQTTGTTLKGQSHHFALDPTLTQDLEALGKSHGATLFATLLSAWVALDHCLTGRRDILIGTPALGRSRGGLERTLGFFVNVLPLRLRLSESPSWGDLIDQTRETVISAMGHQDLPFREIAAQVPAAFSESELTPLFQTLFHLRVVNDPALEGFFVPNRTGHMTLGTAALEPFHIDQQEGQYPLVVEWFKLGTDLHGILKYNTDCLDAERASLLATCYVTLLKQLVANPDSLLDTLDPIPEDLRTEMTGADTPLPPPDCLHHRIARQAATNPEASALWAGGTTLSRGALEDRANALAQTLIDQGVRPGDRVGLHMERSIELVVALLAVLKAGAAFVPLPPDLPEGRLAFILEDADITHVVTDPPLRILLESFSVQALPFAAGEDNRRSVPPVVKVGSEAPAYVMYTSGSTGKPKGVVVPHRALSSYVDAVFARFPLTPEQDAVLLNTPLSFDPAIAQIFVPLCHGARLIVSQPQDHHDPATIAKLTRDQAVTMIYSVPSQLLSWLEHPDFLLCRSLKYVFAGGEVLPAALAARFREILPNARLINVYGPTEATVNVTAWPCPDGDVADRDIRIGRALSHARITVRDPQGRPLPPGMPGEITLGGPCLALGYLNRPQEQAQAFIDDPSRPGETLYRTGDQGRFTQDENGGLSLVFEGRRDRQVKIRGTRIELGEVEAVLRKDPAVSEAVARVISSPSGEKMIAAAVVPKDQTTPPDLEALRNQAAKSLTAAAIPRILLIVEALPLTHHGKLDGAALDHRFHASAFQTPVVPSSSLDSGSRTPEAILTGIWRDLLGLTEISPHQHFFDLGGSSLMLTRLQRMIEDRGLGSIEILTLFRHPTIASLAGLLRSPESSPRPLLEKGAPPGIRGRQRQQGSHAIAVIGMDLRVPGAKDLAGFWSMLLAGAVGTRRFSPKALRDSGVPEALLSDPAYVPVNGVLDDIELFDARFFGYGPREAEILDPQHRLFLETAWHTLEHGGYGQRSPASRVGVFAGSELSNYLLFNLQGQIDSTRMNGGYELSLANDKDFLATRVSYALDLRGPAITVQTACSTSLTAVVQACESLLAGQCDMALAGGVSIQLPQLQGYLYQEGMVASRDGLCRPFDAAASGTINGNGVGAVLLKPLEQALLDGDTVHAVLRGWAINNDGHHKLGYTAPSEEAQAAAVAQAWTHAGIDPADLGYIEAHGTGTPLGDPIEAAALARAWTEVGPERKSGGARASTPGTDPKEKCRLGAVKANIGHLGAASGVIGLIKTVLTVREATIPALAGFETANPKIPFATLPFAVAKTAAPWPHRPGPRTAAVSSFGIGGTNVHMVVEEAPEPPIAGAEETQSPSLPLAILFPVSAGSRKGLETALAQLTDWVTEQEGLDLADLAHTLDCGREAHPWRTLLKAEDRKALEASLTQAMEAVTGPETDRVRHSHAPPKVVALFPGQGAQYPDMTLDLYRTLPSFRTDIDTGLTILAESGDIPASQWKAMLFPSLPGPATAAIQAEAASFLARTEHTQPALFIVEYALARLWERLSVIPTAMFGHSVGEYVAAALAGVFSFADGVRLVATRGRLMQGLPKGDMLAVAQSAEASAPYLVPGIDLAGENGPRQSVLSGPTTAIAEIKARLEAGNVPCQILDTSYAFHSAMMDPILAAYGAVLSGIDLSPPKRPMISGLTGDWLTDEQATDPQYWVAQLRGAVRFGRGLATIMTDIDRAPGPDKTSTVILEMGPGRALSGRARQIPEAATTTILASAPRPLPGSGPSEEGSLGTTFLSAVGDLWLAGAPLRWEALYTQARRRLPLPLYPFDRQRYWIEPKRAPTSQTPSPPTHAGPSPTDIPRKAPPADRFFIPRWSAVPQPPLPPQSKTAEATPAYVLPEGPLAQGLRQDGISVATIPTPYTPSDLVRAAMASDLFLGEVILPFPTLDEVLATAQGLAASGRKVGLTLVTRHAFDTGDGEVDPDAALFPSLVLGLPRENPALRCRLIDCDDPGRLRLSREVGRSDPLVAWRKGRRWLPSLGRISLPEMGQPLLRPKGVVFLTGGLGGIGLAIARHVITRHNSSVLLVGRRPSEDLPPGSRAALAELGPQAATFSADVTDAKAMAAALAHCRARFGAPTTVIHAAGVAAHGPLLDKTRVDIARTLAPKREGARILDELFQDSALDGMIFFSSTSAVLGNGNLLDYAAANAYLDALAHRRTAQGFPTLSIGWDPWADIGMSAGPQAGRDPRLRAMALETEEGLEAFEKMLHCAAGLPHVLVSTGNLEAMRARIIDQARTIEADGKAHEDSGAPPSLHARPDLAVDYIAPSTSGERAITTLWEEILGITGIGVLDNFFDLGGDSLIGSKLVARLNAELGATLSSVQLYDTSTIRALAAAIAPSPSNTSPLETTPKGRNREDDLDIEARSARRRRRTRRNEDGQS
jgi:amino acid adenylation domain-containing protein